MDAENFKEIIRQEFLKRSAKNPRYSLRSYAQSLGVHHSTLSGLLSGKRPITKKAVTHLSLQLGIYPEAFMKKNQFALPRHEVIEEDVFNRISSWSYDAILELSKLKDFVFDGPNVSQALGLGEVQAKMAIETLLRLKLLKRIKGRVQITHAHTTNLSSNETTSAAMRQYQRSILEKSLQALEEVDRKDRDHTSTTLAIRKKDLPKAKKIIQDFRYKLTDLLQTDANDFDEVYQLHVGLFPLTKRK